MIQTLKNGNWRRVAPLAWQQLPLLQPTKIVGSVVISALNVLWHGHGVLRLWPTAARIVGVLVLSYLIVTAAEFLWLLLTVQLPVDLGFQAQPPAPAHPDVDPLVEQPGVVAPPLRAGDN